MKCVCFFLLFDNTLSQDEKTKKASNLLSAADLLVEASVNDINEKKPSQTITTKNIGKNIKYLLLIVSEASWTVDIAVFRLFLSKLFILVIKLQRVSKASSTKIVENDISLPRDLFLKGNYLCPLSFTKKSLCEFRIF